MRDVEGQPAAQVDVSPTPIRPCGAGSAEVRRAIVGRRQAAAGARYATAADGAGSWVYLSGGLDVDANGRLAKLSDIAGIDSNPEIAALLAPLRDKLRIDYCADYQRLLDAASKRLNRPLKDGLHMAGGFTSAKLEKVYLPADGVVFALRRGGGLEDFVWAVTGTGEGDYAIVGWAAWVAEMNTSAAVAAIDEMDLVRRLQRRDAEAFRTVMQAHNQRLFRIARAVLRNDAEAEEAVQEAYVSAFTHLDGFRGDSTLATWLSRIVANEALGRLRARRRGARALADATAEAQIMPFPLKAADPERMMAQRQILHLVERAADSLPDDFRAVFVARAIEGMSGQETAAALGVRLETVNTRLHRARALVRRRLEEEIGPLLLDAFPFAGRRCERLTGAVMSRLGFSD